MRVCLLLLAALATLAADGTTAACVEGKAGCVTCSPLKDRCLSYADSVRPAAGQRLTVSLVGRFAPGPDKWGVAQLPQLFSWPGSSASVAFQGATAVTVVLDATIANLPAGDRWLGNLSNTNIEVPNAVFQFDLDGSTVGLGVINATTDAPVLTWRWAGMTTGRHILTISKRTEARAGLTWLRSISLEGAGGRFLPAPPTPGMRSGRRMLFIGDSFTTGTANIGAANCSRNTFDSQNTLLTWGPTVARTYQADYQVVAWPGASLGLHIKRTAPGWTEDLQRLYVPRMSEIVGRADALDPGSRYNMRSWVPQVVFLAAGLNDFAGSKLSADSHVLSNDARKLPPIDEYAEQTEALVRQIRKDYPRAAIVHIVWPLEAQRAGVLSLEQAAIYLQYMAVAYSSLQAAGIKNTYLLQLNGEALKNDNWCFKHPNVAAHAQIAAQVARFLDGVLPSFG